MNTTTNNLSFKANIKTLTRVDNKRAFVMARNMFKDGTKNAPKDTIYITDASLGEVSIRLSKNNEASVFEEDFYTRDINKQIEEMGIEGFSNKLINIFEALKLHNEASKRIFDIKNEIKRAKILLKNNINYAKSWSSEGKNVIAHRYEVLAENNRGKIDRLVKELQAQTSEFNEKINALSEKCKEFKQLRFF